MDNYLKHQFWKLLRGFKREFLEGVRSFTITKDSQSVFMLMHNDDVFVYGKNENGILGLGHSNEVNSPTKLVGASQVHATLIEHNEGHAFALTSKGTLIGWGQNDCGQVDRTHRISSLLKPRPVKLVHAFIVQVKCACASTLVLTREGKVYYWGQHNNRANVYPLGEDRSDEALKLPPVTHIYAGFMHYAAFNEKTNKIFVWGSNHFGQLGVREEGYVRNHVRVEEGHKIIKVALADFFTLVLTDGGHVYTYGHNREMAIRPRASWEPLPLEEIVLQHKLVLNDELGREIRWKDIKTSWESSVLQCARTGHCYVMNNSAEDPVPTKLTCPMVALQLYGANQHTTEMVDSSKFLCQVNPSTKFKQMMTKAFDDPTRSDFKFIVDNKPIFVYK